MKTFEGVNSLNHFNSSKTLSPWNKNYIWFQIHGLVLHEFNMFACVCPEKGWGTS